MMKESAASGFASVTESIDASTSHLQLLWQAVDELRTDLQWAAQNGRLVVDAGVDFESDAEALSVPVDIATVVHDLDAITSRLTAASREIDTAVGRAKVSSRSPAPIPDAPDSDAPPGHLF